MKIAFSGIYPVSYTHLFVLNDDREKLYQKIELRVDEMVQNGLIDEVKHLKEMGYHRGMVSMQGLGYKEILDYLDDEITLEEAIYRIKRETRSAAAWRSASYPV